MRCYRLEEVILPETIQTIPSSMFEKCYSLKKITIPDSVITICKSAFSSCFKLNDIHFSKNLKVL